MRKFGAVFVTEKDVDFSADAPIQMNNGKYDPVAPGYYTATVTEMKVKDWQGSYKDPDTKTPIVNPKSKDGKWPYVSFTTTIVLHNELGTTITQDFIFGIVDEEGSPFRPGKSKESPIFGGEIGALFLLRSLGLIQSTDPKTHTVLPFDPATITNRVVSVNVTNAGYVKKVKNFSPVDLAKALKEAMGGQDVPFERLAEAVAKYNELNGYQPNGDQRLRIKNHVIGFYPLTPEQIAVGEFYVDEDTKGVFLSEEDYVNYRDVFSNASDGPSGDGW